MQDLEDALEYISAASPIDVCVHDAALPEMNMWDLISNVREQIYTQFLTQLSTVRLPRIKTISICYRSNCS